MRIVYVCADPGIEVFGTKGASVHIQEMVRALQRAGHQVRVVALRRGHQVPADLADLQVDECRVDLPAGGDRESAVIATAAALPDRVFAEPVDLVYERYSLFSAAVQQQADRRGIPSVLEVNSPLIDEQQRHRTLVHLAAAEQSLRTAAKAASVVVCVSEPVRDWVLGHQPVAATLVVPNGVDTNRIAPRSECGNARCRGAVAPAATSMHTPAATPMVAPAATPMVTPAATSMVTPAATPMATPPTALTVGFVGTLKPWHGVDVLIRAIAVTRSAVRLLVVGDGPQARMLQQLAGELEVDAEFTGAVPPTAIAAELHRMDIAVAPGNSAAAADDGAVQYFSPLKVFEYAAAGLPIVAGRIGQVTELLVDGSTALLVTPGDPAAIAAAIDRLAADPPAAAALGAAARRWVAGHSWDAVAATVLRAADNRVGVA